MYTVKGRVFEDFDAVISFAWNTYKIDFSYEDEVDELVADRACRELESMIDEFEQA